MVERGDYFKMSVWAYLFEGKGIQRYLFMAGKLRDVVGASDLVTQLASSDGIDLIGSCIASVLGDVGQSIASTVDGSSGKVSFSRRAGGAFCLHGSYKDLTKIRGVFRLAVMSALPGLEISDALGEGDTELTSQAAAVKNSGGSRANMAASVLPLGRPVFEIVPGTGLPRISHRDYRDSKVPLDQIQLPLRLHGDDLQARMGTAIASKRRDEPANFVIDGVAKRFHLAAEGDNKAYAYPRNLSDEIDNKAGNPMFPWIETDYRLALVHADISGLGEAFQNAVVATAAEKLKFAKDIEDAINSSVKKANRDTLQKHEHIKEVNEVHLVPARPLVVGGDDLTILVRADLALDFTAALLKNIELETKGIAGGLSACAGVAIGNRSMPFLNLHELAETLCKFAKRTAKQGETKPYPSMMAFHHQTQTSFEDYERDVYASLKISGNRVMTANPYEVCESGQSQTNQSTYRQLKDLAQSIRNLSGAASAIRQVEGSLADDEPSARSKWYRLMARPDQADGQKDKFSNFTAHLKLIDAEFKIDEIPFNNEQTPLFDALALIDFGRLKAETVAPGEAALAVTENEGSAQ